jgi:hypothetical protein
MFDQPSHSNVMYCVMWAWRCFHYDHDSKMLKDSVSSFRRLYFFQRIYLPTLWKHQKTAKAFCYLLRPSFFLSLPEPRCLQTSPRISRPYQQTKSKSTICHLPYSQLYNSAHLHQLFSSPISPPSRTPAASKNGRPLRSAPAIHQPPLPPLRLQ